MQKITAVEMTHNKHGESVVTVRGARRKVLVRETFELAAHARPFRDFCRKAMRKQTGDARA